MVEITKIRIKKVRTQYQNIIYINHENSNQNIGCDIRAVVYALRGMLDEAAAAYNQCQPPYWNDIFKIMLNYPFKEKVLAEKFAYGLYLAKVPGEPSSYYKIYDESRLGSHEISRLVVNRKLRAFVNIEVWILEFFKNSFCTCDVISGIQPLEKGTYRIEGDAIRLDLPKRFLGEKFQASVYKNPDGTLEVGNVYFFVSKFGVYPFSYEEE